MVGELDFDTVRDFATALLIGTLLGIERERHKQSDGDISVGGLRTSRQCCSAERRARRRT